MKIGFIGAGNMGGAILRGYVPYAEKAGDELSVYVPTEEKLNSICKETGAAKCSGIDELVRSNDVIIIGVKPNMFEEVLPQVAGAYNTDKVVVSMAAGVTIEFIEGYLGKDAKIVRIMPNTPAQVGCGVSAVCPVGLSEEETGFVKSLLDTCGTSILCDEKTLDAIGCVSGTGPAYVMLFIEAMADAAVSLGIKRDDALKIAAGTIMGSGKLCLDTGKNPAVLKDMVCSPGGTTIAGVMALEENGFRNAVIKSVTAAYDKTLLMQGRK